MMLHINVPKLCLKKIRRNHKCRTWQTFDDLSERLSSLLPPNPICLPPPGLDGPVHRGVVRPVGGLPGEAEPSGGGPSGERVRADGRVGGIGVHANVGVGAASQGVAVPPTHLDGWLRRRRNRRCQSPNSFGDFRSWILTKIFLGSGMSGYSFPRNFLIKATTFCLISLQRKANIYLRIFVAKKKKHV